MLRFLAGAGSAVLLILAGFFIWKGMAQDEEALVPPAPEPLPAPSLFAEAQPAPPPAADARTKEERRFDRADKNGDGRITLDELYQPRRKAFERLDTNGDGRLSFEEWAVRTREKFQKADANRDGQLTRREYATTAPRPRTKQQNCRC